jgi:quercetin dioxygenase-like cupin family protein
MNEASPEGIAMQPRVIPAPHPIDPEANPASVPATILLGHSDTSSAFALVRVGCLRGKEPPLRRHHREDLAIHLLDGDVAFQIDGRTHRLRSGGTVLVPRGVEHGYALRSATADLLVVLTPAGAETCLVDLHAGTPVERLVIAAAHHGIEITGPPPRVEKRK